MIDEQLTLHDPDMFCFGFIMGYKGYRKALGNNGTLFPGDTLKAWRRDAIGDTRFSDEFACHDFTFLKDMCAKKLNVAMWDEPLYYHDYMRPGSITEMEARK